jgi:hypothetical protein
VALRLEDRSGRHVQALGLAGRRDIEAAERRSLFLQGQQIGFVDQRQLGERRPRIDSFRIDPGQLLGPARRRHCADDNFGHPREQLALARGGVAGFEGVVVFGHGYASQRLRRL